MASKPSLLLVGLEGFESDMFRDIYSHQLSLLQREFEVINAQSANAAVQIIAGQSRPCAVLIVGTAIHDGRYAAARRSIVQLVQAGGTAIYCGLFSSMSDMNQIRSTFKDAFALPWQPGSYLRTTHAPNPNCAVQLGDLPEPYSMKAVHLQDLAPGDAVYLPTADAQHESLVFQMMGQAQQVNMSGSEAPITFTQVGTGYVGYMGDVNNEAPSQDVVLAMCRLAAKAARPP